MGLDIIVGEDGVIRRVGSNQSSTAPKTTKKKKKKKGNEYGGDEFYVGVNDDGTIRGRQAPKRTPMFSASDFQKKQYNINDIVTGRADYSNTLSYINEHTNDNQNSGGQTDRFIGPQPFIGPMQEPRRVATPSTTQFVQGGQSGPSGSNRGTGGSNYSALRQYNSDQEFNKLMKEAIQRKQGFNTDIRAAKERFNTQLRDPMTFTDKSLQLLSPAEQQALRNKRYATANARLDSLREEEKYRGTRLEDILAELNREQEGRASARREDRLARGDNYDAIKNKRYLGIPLTDEDYKSIGVDSSNGRVGGSVSWRNNNSGNLKYADWEKAYGATKDPNSAFAVFKNEDDARNAYKMMLTSNTNSYKGLSNDEKMWRWSGSGKDSQPSYTYKDLIAFGAPDVNKDFKDFSDSEWNQFFEAQKKKEGWSEGETINTKGSTKHEVWTEAAVRELAKNTGNKATDLWNNKTDAELDDLAAESKKSFVDYVVNGIDKKKLLSIGLTDEGMLKDILTLKYEMGRDDEYIEGLMENMGIATKTKDGLNVLSELDNLINPV